MVMGAMAAPLRAQQATPPQPAVKPYAGGKQPTVATDFFIATEKKLEKAAFLGISSSPVPAILRDQLKLQKGMGLMVDHVDADSPAEAAGVKQYDILYKLDDQLLINAHQFAVLIRRSKPDDEIKLTLYHQGKQTIVSVKPKEKEVMPLDDNNPWGGTTGLYVEDAAGPVLADPGFAFTTPRPAENTTTKSLSWFNDQYTWQVTVKGTGDKHRLALRAKDKKGGVVFDGTVSEGKEPKGLPKSIAEWLNSPATQGVLKEMEN
jgi:hypothetical protein